MNNIPAPVAQDSSQNIEQSAENKQQKPKKVSYKPTNEYPKHLKEFYEVLNVLKDKFPLLFAQPEVRIMKVGIKNDLCATKLFSNKRLCSFLSMYTRRKPYFDAHVLDAPRYDLDGNIIANVTAKEIESKLKEQQQIIKNNQLSKEKKEIEEPLIDQNIKNIRLTELEISNIKKCFLNIFQKTDTLYIFGSRIDPKKKGGDIDLYIETTISDINEIAKLKIKFITKLMQTIGEQKIDVVIKSTATKKDLPIHLEAKKTGIKLI